MFASGDGAVAREVGQQGILKSFFLFYREHCKCVISLASWNTVFLLHLDLPIIYPVDQEVGAA